MRYWPILARLFVTLGMLTIIRLGYFIPVPGVDMARLPAAADGMEGESSGIARLAATVVLALTVW